MELLDRVVQHAAALLELLGVAAIVIGVVVAFVRAARARHGYERLRLELGRAILLGLELLVGADILRSVSAEPSLQGVAVLGLIVLVRTFLSMTLTVELEGRWPWQRRS